MGEKNTFYSDINLVDLPIFTANKIIKSENRKEIINLNKKNQKTKLVITYGKEKLTWFDRKVIASLEYIFGKQFDFNIIQEEINIIIKTRTEEYLNIFKTKKIGDLSNSEKQQIIYDSMFRLSKNYGLSVTLKTINDILNPNFYNHGNIKKSLFRLSETRIENESDYFIDSSKLTVSFNLLDINMSETKAKQRQNINIYLNPFHFYNLVRNNTIKSDLKLLSSFEIPIAGRLSEVLKKSLYGCEIHNNSKIIFEYDYICEYLHIKKFKTQSRIIQQLEPALNELRDKKIVINWLLQKNLLGFEVIFYRDFNFYEEYYKLQDEGIKRQILKKENELLNNDELRDKIEKKTNHLLKHISISNKEIEKVKGYYRKYLILTEDFN